MTHLIRSMRPSPNLLPQECTCDPCCLECGHDPKCGALVVPECTCPEESEDHSEDCPEDNQAMESYDSMEPDGEGNW